jgi:hypothetical protein
MWLPYTLVSPGCSCSCGTSSVLGVAAGFAVLEEQLPMFIVSISTGLTTDFSCNEGMRLKTQNPRGRQAPRSRPKPGERGAGRHPRPFS